MEKTRERELKLEADEEVELEALGGRALDARTFTSMYYDTPERRLSRLGITLRRRTENGVGTWQLKLPRAEGQLKLEENGGSADAPPRLRGLLVAALREETIEPVATLKTSDLALQRASAAKMASSTSVRSRKHSSEAIARTRSGMTPVSLAALRTE